MIISSQTEKQKQETVHTVPPFRRIPISKYRRNERSRKSPSEHSNTSCSQGLRMDGKAIGFEEDQVFP